MAFTLRWTATANAEYVKLRDAARKAKATRETGGNSKSSEQEGLFKQVYKSLQYLAENPRHPSLNTHQYDSLPHPWDQNAKVFEAYVQNRTPGAYRVFWCYGRDKGEITIIAITPHP